MGCFPLSFNKKVTNQDTEGNENQETDYNDKKINVHGGLFLKELSGDPFVFYTVQSTMGEGAFGKVYKVIHKTTGSLRAMKVINKIKAQINDDSDDDLINEINILKVIDHPNIMKIYEFFNTPRKLFIISELCTGGELFDKITEVKHFNEKIAAHIMSQLLSVISFCHAKNIVHRDLKPENMLIESEEERTKDYFNIKIIDFGTSKISKKSKLLSKQIGTPFYIAPEVLNNEYTEKCDLWSAGVIMYILLSGLPPFNGDSEEEIYKKVREGNYSFKSSEWNEISDDAKDLIKNLLVKDYKKRFSANQALNHVWIKKLKESSDIKPISKDNLSKIAKNIQSFQTNHKLQQAALSYIVHNLTKKEDLKEIRQVFVEFDTNCDGKLTKQEFVNGLSKVISTTEAQIEVNRIMDMIDGDNNGYIEYEEFIQASLHKDKLITEDNLKIVFNLFDKDKSGKISLKEIQSVLCTESDIPEEVWEETTKKIIRDDVDGDGEIDYNEFKKMMEMIMK